MQPEVLYHIADTYELKGDKKRAMKMLNLTYDFVGTEPGLLARLGAMHSQSGKRDEAMRLFHESYEQLSSIDVLSVLCNQYLNEERYDSAAKLFGVAATMQPSHLEWQLMVAGCHKSAHRYEEAIAEYEKVW
jgi:intraflagellar transport protein 88